MIEHYRVIVTGKTHVSRYLCETRIQAQARARQLAIERRMTGQHVAIEITDAHGQPVPYRRP
jgi:hypothetical protein